VQWLIFLRPADLLKHPEAEKLFAALGPNGELWQRELETIAGVPLAEVESVLAASVEQMGGASTMMYVVRYPSSTRDKLLAAWKNPAPEKEGNEEIVTVPAGAAWLPAKEGGKVAVTGPRAMVIEAVKMAGNRPPLGRELEKMLLTTDSARLLTLVFQPPALFAPGMREPQTATEKALAQAGMFFGSSRGAALSAALTKDDCFLELRVQGSLDFSSTEVAQMFQEQMSNLPDRIETYLATLDQQLYSRRLLLRFPPMLRRLEDFTRSGVEGDQAVLRCYLPVMAAHNLVLGTELVLAESAGAGEVPVATAPKSPQTAAERLKQVTSLRFANEPLERALTVLGDDIGVKVEILGVDLEADGITRNQAIVNLDENNRPAQEIFRAIMLKANPDGKLVYVIRPGQDGQEILTVTTRGAAAKRGEKLPPEFAQP
jgi:hypothetical protein